MLRYFRNNEKLFCGNESDMKIYRKLFEALNKGQIRVFWDTKKSFSMLQQI